MHLRQILQRAISLGLLTALAFLSLTAGGEPKVTLMHIHGLAFSPDGQQLSIPSHHGLAVYSDGRWSKAPGLEHDYMGFSMTRRAIYSSGHPAPGSGLANPLGLIKSTDGGSTWQSLGLQGESDFHLLAASFGTGALYVYNAHQNSRMNTPGLYASQDDGATWRRASAQGLGKVPVALAVHPTDSKVVAAVTEDGLFLSLDGGEHFQSAVQDVQVLSAAFSVDGKSLWFGGYEGSAQLSVLNLESHQISTLAVPPLDQDGAAYLVQNPVRPQEWAMATFKRDVYLSQDEGKSWVAIARAGQPVE